MVQTEGPRRASRVAILALGGFLAGCESGREAASPVSLIDTIGGATAEYDEARFRSVFKDGRLSRWTTMEGRTEHAITLPVPSSIRYRLHVPDEPLFRPAFALSTLGAGTLNAPAEVAVVVEANGSEARLLEHKFPIRRAEPSTDRWWDGDVDLSPWAGREITLRLESRWTVERSVRQAALVLWGDPVLASRSRAPSSSKPNLVLISIDCLRADHVGAYGYERDTTPNLDAFAAESELFEQAFSTASWTLPAHMSMLTGELPSLHGATKWEKLDVSVPYLPELLSTAGYRSAGVVSWVYLSQAYGFERGFDSYEVLPEPRASDIVDRALAELDRGAGQSQFLFMHLYDPHWPYLPPPELIGRFGPRPRDVSEVLRRLGDGEPPSDSLDIDDAIRLYDGEIAFVDRELGRFFDALRERGLFSQTLVIVTADHGEAFTEHGHWQHSQTLYDEITHVPLLVKWPASARIGRRKDLASLVDVFATLAEAGGARPSEHELGSAAQSLDITRESRTVASEFAARSPEGTSLKVAFRTNGLKYIATLEAPAGHDLALTLSEVGREELYDLASDPQERDDVARGRGEDVLRLRGELADFLEAARHARQTRNGQKVELDEETLRKLESLGYVHSKP